MKKTTGSRITEKLKKRFVAVYTGIFLLLSLVVLTAAAGVILYNTRKSVSSQISIISDSLSSYQKGIREKVYLLLTLPELSSLLEEYEKDPSDENLARVNLYLSSFQSGDSDLLYLCMEEESGLRFHSLVSSGSGFEDFLREREDYKKMLSMDSSCFSPVLEEGFEGRSVSYCYYITRQEISGKSFLIILCYNAQTLVKNISTAAGSLGDLEIFDQSGSCIFHLGDQELFAEPPAFTENSSSTPSGRLTGKGYHLYLTGYDTSACTVGTVFWGVLLRNFVLLAACLFVVYFIPLAAALLYVIPATDRHLKPIRLLSRDVQEFSLGNEPIRIYETGDEIEDLSRSFRQMEQNINLQSAAIQKQEREKAVTYYKLLTTQLDPHFIYNTMNIINILARNHAWEDIIKVNTALTRVLRERLNTQNTTFEEVGKEIDALKQYQVIMDYRYHHQVAVDYDIDESVLHRRIPKNILQPLLENSYYHGLTRESGEIAGNIGIVIYAMEDELIIEISDDGKGFSPERLETVRRELLSAAAQSGAEAHIGIQNIYSRIQYLYGDAFSMDIQSEYGHGATVVISLPLEEGKERFAAQNAGG